MIKAFIEDCYPKKPSVVDELSSIILEYKNQLQFADPENMTEEQDQLVYLLTRTIKKHLESRFMDRLLTDELKIEMKYELSHILKALRQLTPIDEKIKWECIADKYNGSVTLRAYIDDEC